MKTKTLFLIDGAFGDAKIAICNLVQKHSEWQLLQKMTTKKIDDNRLNETKTYLDLTNYFFEEQTWIPGTKKLDTDKACELLKIYNGSNCRTTDVRYFCYAYPRLIDETNKQITEPSNDEEINIIDTLMLDKKLSNEKHKYYFLIVRRQEVIRDLQIKYEISGQVNVVPIFIYTDSKMIKQSQAKNAGKKFDKLYNDYIEARPGGNRDEIYYEDTIIFRGRDFEEAQANLEKQFKTLIEESSKKDLHYFVVSGEEKYFLPSYIQKYKDFLQEALNADLSSTGVKLKGIDGFRKRCFVIMQFEQENVQVKWEAIKTAFDNAKESSDYVRADLAQYNTLRIDGDSRPDVEYWLKMFMCKYAIAIFDSDENNKLIINPNVVYEMGIMKQQGKKVHIIVPKGVVSRAGLPDEDKLFFDVSNDWKYKYDKNNLKTLTEEVSKIIKLYNN